MLHQLPPLEYLGLSRTSIGDEGVASMVAQPTAGALISLEMLNLKFNQISDVGCATLASALRGGELPALKVLNLEGDTQLRAGSQQARDAVQAALAARSH